MIKRTNKYVNDFMNSNYYAIFIVHRRVMTILYKRTGLTGYKIELLLMICKLCQFRLDIEIVGSQIREKCSKRFTSVLGSMIDELVASGYITDRRKSGATKQSWHYISLAEKGYEFYELWNKEVKRLVQDEKDQLIISISNTQDRDKNKLSFKKKLNKGLSPSSNE